MNYDIFGPWLDTAGPNAPLNDTCLPSSVPAQGSAVSAVAAWTAAGIPANQIVLGVASYGHSFSVSKEDALGSSGKLSQSYPPFDKNNQPDGDAWQDAAGTDVCGVEEPKG